MVGQNWLPAVHFERKASDLVTTKTTSRSREHSPQNLNSNLILCESRLYKTYKNINITV